MEETRKIIRDLISELLRKYSTFDYRADLEPQIRDLAMTIDGRQASVPESRTIVATPDLGKLPKGNRPTSD